MARMTSGSESLPITSAGVVHAASGIRVPTVRLWVELAFARRFGPPLLSRCLVDTVAPLCVVPFAIHDPGALAWQAIPGPWPPGFTTWQGVPCDLGRIDVWLSAPDLSLPRAPRTFIAKFPQATPTQMPARMPILLGLNFLADHWSEITFQCHTL